jgi:hypothetical protein
MSERNELPNDEDVRFEDLPRAQPAAHSIPPADVPPAAPPPGMAAAQAASAVPPSTPLSSGGLNEKMPSQPSLSAAPESTAGPERLPPNTPTPPGLEDAFETEKADEFYFDESDRTYWLRNASRKWVFVGKDEFKLELRKLGKSDKADVKNGKPLSEIDDIVRDTTLNSRVAYAGLLAGYKAGVYTVAGRRVLVSESLVLAEPKKGVFPLLTKFFEGLLTGKEPADDKGGMLNIDQRLHYFGWLQHVVKCLYEGRTDSGLALFMAGEPDSGKSFQSLLLRWILGGRVARPYDRMIGQDKFNKSEIESVLLLVDDDNQGDTKLESRLKFGGETKKIVANNEFQARTMHRDGFAIEVLRRLVVLVNLQLARLQVLPPMDGDMNDKAMLFKGYRPPLPAGDLSTWSKGRPTENTPYAQACWPAPMPTRTPEEKEAYREAIKAELPAFIYWLLHEFKLPPELTGGRFVVRHWHHPVLLSQLHELGPHTRIWELLIRSQVVFHTWMGQGADTGGKLVLRPAKAAVDGEDAREEGEWRGSASDLEKLLKGPDSKLTLDERREIPLPNWLGQRLTACSEHFGPRACLFVPGRTKKTWILKPRPEDRDNL